MIHIPGLSGKWSFTQDCPRPRRDIWKLIVWGACTLALGFTARVTTWFCYHVIPDFVLYWIALNSSLILFILMQLHKPKEKHHEQNQNHTDQGGDSDPDIHRSSQRLPAG